MNFWYLTFSIVNHIKIPKTLSLRRREWYLKSWTTKIWKSRKLELNKVGSGGLGFRGRYLEWIKRISEISVQNTFPDRLGEYQNSGRRSSKIGRFTIYMTNSINIIPKKRVLFKSFYEGSLSRVDTINLCYWFQFSTTPMYDIWSYCVVVGGGWVGGWWWGLFTSENV